jgi:hypothetical protein
MNERETAAWLMTPAAIRERCEKLLLLGLEGRLPHFEVRLDELGEVAHRVAAVTLRDYPDLRIPVHGRMTHFDVGGAPRRHDVARALEGLPASEQARAWIDLVVVSVLLDAGAGAAWGYVDKDRGRYARSEGLAVASLRAFLAGVFSSDPARPAMADAVGLRAVTAQTLGAAFQVSADNPLVGLPGRVALLHGLADALPRPGVLYDRLLGEASHGLLPAAKILAAVLDGLGGIWPGRLQLGSKNLGDVWPHSSLGRGTDALVPFHKLSQWLSYSLFEPLEGAGLSVVEPDALTGLAEYRNGGLFIDLGVLVPRDPALLREPYAPDHEAIVEWRALTVALLDRLRPLVATALGLGEPQLALAQLLQGGTWTAGREVAAQKRTGGGPPIHIVSDGTVF